MMDVEINKPMYGTYVGIYSKWVHEAIRDHKMLHIIITDVGSAVHDPHEWIKTGKKIKKIFRFACRPMTLYCNYVNIEPVKSYTFEQMSFI